MTILTAKAVVEEQIVGARGLSIFVRSWQPNQRSRGVVAICHGVKSHGGYYAWAAEQLVSRGYSVYALDLHGRGKSEGERLYLESIADYVADVDALISLALSREPGRPVFLLGHSAGGVVSCVYTLDHGARLAGLICESFAFQVAAPDAALAVVKGVRNLLPRFPLLRLKNEDFSRDPAVVQAMKADPLVADEVQPIKTVAELVRGVDRLRREFARITLPVLILHGTDDKVTNPKGSRLFFEMAGSRDKTLKLYERHVHDLLNDVGRERVMGDIAGWLEAHVVAK